MFLKPFFSAFEKTFFQNLRAKFLSLAYMIALAYKNSQIPSANHNPDLRCAISTGVILLALIFKVVLTEKLTDVKYI